MKQKLKKRSISPAKCFIRIAFLLVVAVATALLISFLEMKQEDPVAARLYFLPFLEYITTSAFIAIGGTFFIKWVAEQSDQK